MQLIPLSEVLKEMDKKELIKSISFVTADRKRGTGGELVTLKNVIQTGRTSKEGKTSGSGESTTEDRPARNPNHWKNQTRNLRIAKSNQVRKVHIRLITEFNGQRVIW